jgi:hypothetical protein
VTGLAFSIPDELVETIAQRAASIVLEVSTPQESESLWLTLEEAGQRLGCSADAVRMGANRGRYESRYIGRRRYVSRVSVDGIGTATKERPR